MPVTAKVIHKRHIKLPDKIKGPQQVKVGFPTGTKSEQLNKAIWNHYGTDTGIPARPFMTNALRDNRRTYKTNLVKSVKKLLRSETTLKTILSKLGVLAQGDIQAEITNLSTPPNKPQTIRRKGSSNPLVDTGAMRRAVTWELDG